MRTVSIAAALAVSWPAFSWPAFAQQTATPPPDLTQWAYQELYDHGWRAQQLLDTVVYGTRGDEIGEVENIVVSPDGRIQRVLVAAGDGLALGDVHFAVAWPEVKVAADMASVTVPVTDANVTGYSLFAGRTAYEGAEPGPRPWKVSELIGDYVNLEGGVRFGIVEDLIFDRTGELKAVVAEPDAAYGDGYPYAFPAYGWSAGFDPGLDYWTVPYTRDEVAAMEPFDYDAMNGGVFADR